MHKSRSPEEPATARVTDYGRLAMISGDEDADVILGGGRRSGSRKNRDKSRVGVASCRESLQIRVSSSSWWKRRRRNPETGLFSFLILLSGFILLSVLVLALVIYLNYLGLGRHRTPPDPCDGIQCPASQVCQMDDNRSPICRCNAICSSEVRPVCGSDGKTYSNECALRVEACKSRRSLRIIYSGDCATGENPCENLHCGPGEDCDIDRYGMPTCLCPPPCEPVMRPVCASDGKTYDSECELRRYSCVKKITITVAFRGACGEEGPCVGKECTFGAVCVVSRGQAVCECPSCSEEFLPVCGTDAVSYTNECKLRRESCLTAKEISVKSEGLCSGCGSKRCDFYAICETAEGTREEEKAKCVCPTSCDKHEAPVCGNDAITYPNECSLKVAACKRQLNIIVASQGPCDLCQNVHCKYKARCENGRCVCPKECPETYEPVCASDGSTYANECEMRKASCYKNDEFSALFYGECTDVAGVHIDSRACKDAICRFGGICDVDSEGLSHCVCHFQCERLTDPVCGSDGKLYSNECKLREESCQQQKMIRIVHIDGCDKPKVTPCDGDRPLRDPNTGIEYYCGEGEKSRPCPADSYCHKSSSFAKCCREDGSKGAEARECVESEFGCCPDGFTAALGTTNAGCPSDCLCNRLGSIGETCDPVSKQCHCRTGVGGPRCDRCEPGYWGLHKIADGNNGCAPCACNKKGSVRDDCEQMTGRCVCRHGIQGMKCDICPPATILTNDGCTDASIAYPVPGTCSQLRCRFGANCQERGHGKAQCVCDVKCNPEPKNPVCGSDGVAYASECQLRLFSCRYQKQINIKTFGLCKIDGAEPTVGPVRRSTVQKSTSEQYESRSTRDITFGLSEGLFLSTGPTTARPTIDAFQFETPGFSGRSYLELERLHAYTRLSLELEFKSYADEGILLYNGQTQSGIGDFVSLAIKNGYVEFRYNLGSGPVVLRSPHRLQTGRFHKLVAKRYLRDGTLTLDGKVDVSGRSEGVLKSLDLGQNLFLGYVPVESKTVFENIGTKNGLVGCIRRLRIGSKDTRLNLPESKDIIGAEKIRECADSACTSLPCQNGASCVDSQDNYECLCPMGFAGIQCEIQKDPCASNPCPKGSKCSSRKDGTFDCGCSRGPRGKICDQHHGEFQEVFTPYLDGQAYLKLPTLQNVGQSFSIEIWFLAHSKNGMLVYNGQLASGRGDFISVNLVDGFVQFRYDLGSGIANLSGLVVLTSPSPITLEEWHAVLVTRLSRQGTLRVDDGPVVTGESKTPLSELNLDQPLYLGGYKHLSMVNPHSGIVTGLSGALQRLIVNGDIWDALRSRAHEVHQLGKFTGPPCGERPCLNDGVCVPELNEYYCRCPLNYSGLKCEKYIQNGGKEYSISLEGATTLSFSMKEKDKDAQSTNRFDVRFRTSGSNGLLMWTHKGATVRGDYLSLALSGGFVELSFNLGKQRDLLIIRNPVKIDDGLWHVVSINRNKRLATLQVDNSPPVGKMSEPGATELNTDGILWIGGNAKLPPGLPKPYYDFFRGCVHSVLMEGELINLAQYAPSTNAQPCAES